jgi:hypothetical protein
VRKRLDWNGRATTGLELLQGAQVGDHILAGYGGPQPRVRRGL